MYFQDLKLFFIYSALLIFVMLLAEFLYRFLDLKTEWTRKVAHVGSGLVALTYPDFLSNHWIVFALTLSFTVILFTSKKKGLFHSIFSVGRKSYGELFFVWSSWILFVIYQYTGKLIWFYIPFGIVVFADSMAALVGSFFPLKKYVIFKHTKSIGGSSAFFIISTITTYYFLYITGHEHNVLLFSLLHALTLTIVEAISTKGFDNLSIPLVSILFLYLFNM